MRQPITRIQISVVPVPDLTERDVASVTQALNEATRRFAKSISQSGLMVEEWPHGRGRDGGVGVPAGMSADTPAAAHLRAMRDAHGVESPEALDAMRQRLAEMSADDAGPMALWMLSFSDEEDLGACFVAASGGVQAVMASHSLGINPGGQVEFVGPFPLDAFAPEWQDRLLTVEEVEDLLPLRQERRQFRPRNWRS